MSKIRVSILVLAVALGVAGPAVAARASSAGTLTIEGALAVTTRGQGTCTGGASYPTCHSHYTGAGLGADGRTWNIELDRFDFRPCLSPSYGTWRVTAADGSGDSLFGTFRHRPIQTVVTGGTGAYEGASSDASGTPQSFSTIFVPTLVLGLGCSYGQELTDAYVGSLAFTFDVP
jgi:hypothetical protein